MGRSRLVIVGIFFLAGLFFTGLVIFLIGDERRLFESSTSYETSFIDVQGLKGGSPVRMGGLDIGHVETVGYSKKDRGDTTIYVKFSVVQAETGRIKIDSKARISTKGLLGDKIIEITVGESDEVQKPGAYIAGEPPEDFMGKITSIGTKAEAVMDNVERATKPLGDEKLHRDLQGSIASMNKILKDVAEGDGYPHRLLTDPAEAERISRLFASLERTSNELTTTLQATRNVIGRVERGPGFAHDLIYGDGPAPEIAQFGRAADELAITLKGVREGNGLAKDVLFGGKGDSAQALANITALTNDLRVIVADMRAGKGTIGGLLVDPSVYEDVKIVLGNVQRNDVLRALVRYSINQDEKKTNVEVTPPKPVARP
jgi:phospholipid/cholesterol/gamma-HCH transport system substrate-binding protein